jgi:hypothetical protein
LLFGGLLLSLLASICLQYLADFERLYQRVKLLHPSLIKDKITEITLARLADPINNHQLTQLASELEDNIANAEKDCLNSPDPVTGNQCWK